MCDSGDYPCSGDGPTLENHTCMNSTSEAPFEEPAVIAVLSAIGVLVLLVLALFLVTVCLLCKILRRLQWLQSPEISQKAVENGEENAAVEHSKDPRSDDHTGDGNKDGLNSELGAKIPNRGIPEHAPPAVGSAIEAMYAAIPKEHLEQKRKKNQICIQQYDDIDLLPLESHTESDGSHLQVSVTMQGDNNEYSRLCHVGPRMSQTKKHTQHHSSSEQLLHDPGKRGGMRLCAANANDDHSYSEVTCSTPKLVDPNIMGKYSLLDTSFHAPHNVDGVPPLPKRHSVCSPSPVESSQNTPNICVTSASLEGKSSSKPYKNVLASSMLDQKDGNMLAF